MLERENIQTLQSGLGMLTSLNMSILISGVGLADGLKT